jgi:DNA primase
MALPGPIPEEILSEILSRASIVDVIGEHLPLRKVGNGFQGVCPFHADSKPSFHVNETRQFFHCFGCGAGGNVYHFLMRMHHMTFPEAVRHLAGRYGVELPERPQSPEEKRRRAEREGLFEVNELGAAFFRSSLNGSQGEAARRYLEGRGISPETTEMFDLGYAPPGWHGLVDHLKRASVDLRSAERAGLIIPRKSKGYYDRFRDRLIFPIHDEAGRNVGFGGRTLGEDLPKYINSPDSPLFAKKRNLYGLHRARHAIRAADTAVVVEGYTDLLALHQYGVGFAVATLGTALTLDHLRTLKRHTSNIVHVFDADEAGERATLRAVDLCLDGGVWARVLRLPPGHDPDTYVREKGGEAFQDELRRAVPLLEFWIQRLTERHDIDALEGKIRVLDEMVPRLRRLGNKVAVDHYAAMTAERLGIAESRIHEMLDRGAKARRQRPIELEAEDEHRTEKLLLEAVLKEPALGRCLREEILEEFQSRSLRELGAMLAAWCERGEADLRKLETMAQAPELAKVLADMLAHLDEVQVDPDKICEDCLKHLKGKGLERRIRLLDQEISQARHQSDEARLRALEEQKIDLVQQKARLRMSSFPKQPGRNYP